MPKESDLPLLRCPILPLFRGCSPPSGPERVRPPKDTSLLGGWWQTRCFGADKNGGVIRPQNRVGICQRKAIFPHFDAQSCLYFEAAPHHRDLNESGRRKT